MSCCCFDPTGALIAMGALAVACAVGVPWILRAARRLDEENARQWAEVEAGRIPEEWLRR